MQWLLVHTSRAYEPRAPGPQPQAASYVRSIRRRVRLIRPRIRELRVLEVQIVIPKMNYCKLLVAFA